MLCRSSILPALQSPFSFAFAGFAKPVLAKPNGKGAKRPQGSPAPLHYQGLATALAP